MANPDNKSLRARGALGSKAPANPFGIIRMGGRLTILSEDQMQALIDGPLADVQPRIDEEYEKPVKRRELDDPFCTLAAAAEQSR